MKIGLLGGTFDPVHRGHLEIAGEVGSRLGLDEVIFIPAAITPLKEGATVTPVEHRVEMVRLAIEGNPYFSLSTVEIYRTGPCYTVDTIVELRGLLGDESELYFIMGCDSLSSLPRWKDPDRLVRACRLVSVPRPGCSLPDIEALEAEVPGIKESVVELDGPYIDISASEIREMAAAGKEIGHLVPDVVAEYIEKYKLYSSG